MEGGSFEIWRRMGGDGPLSWEGMLMGVVCGEVFRWDGKCFAKMSTLRLGWGLK